MTEEIKIPSNPRMFRHPFLPGLVFPEERLSEPLGDDLWIIDRRRMTWLWEYALQFPWLKSIAHVSLKAALEVMEVREGLGRSQLRECVVAPLQPLPSPLYYDGDRTIRDIGWVPLPPPPPVLSTQEPIPSDPWETRCNNVRVELDLKEQIHAEPIKDAWDARVKLIEIE